MSPHSSSGGLSAAAAGGTADGPTWSTRRFAVALALVNQLGAFPAAAQAFRFVPTVQPELTAGVTAGARSTAFAGIGLNRPAGYYVRAGASMAVGRELAANPGTIVRAEITGRFLADPFAEWRWGPYAGGGVAVEAGAGRRGSAALMLYVGTEFPGRTGWRPAIEVGFGGGARVALVFRPARRAGR